MTPLACCTMSSYLLTIWNSKKNTVKVENHLCNVFHNMSHSLFPTIWFLQLSNHIIYLIGDGLRIVEALCMTNYSLLWFFLVCLCYFYIKSKDIYKEKSFIK